MIRTQVQSTNPGGVAMKAGEDDDDEIDEREEMIDDSAKVTINDD